MLSAETLSILNDQIKELVDNFLLPKKDCSEKEFLKYQNQIDETITGLFLYRSLSKCFFDYKKSILLKNKQYSLPDSDFTPEFCIEDIGYYIPESQKWDNFITYIQSDQKLYPEKVQRSINTLYKYINEPNLADALKNIHTTKVFKHHIEKFGLTHLISQIDNLCLKIEKLCDIIYIFDAIELLRILIVNELSARIYHRYIDLDILINTMAEFLLQDYYDLDYFIEKNIPRNYDFSHGAMIKELLAS